ncbi:thioester dehydrase [Candidatus Colwellia aromaticivorans]|uniref:ApeI family dehydratase n=1 Tax=Candidatus Colwellia aromaticivorans TaxID=2267621 RepID=UPI000DF2C687|nr:thioester dehydrase [Candidatus Colwellia aromaticivorans]
MNKLQETQPLFIKKEIIGEGVKLTFKVQASLDYFKGHFPNVSILAGVVQLNWAVNFAHEHLKLSSTVVRQVEVLKFKEIIHADQIVDLSLIRKSDHKFLFEYHSEKGVHASGRILLEETMLEEAALEETL